MKTFIAFILCTLLAFVVVDAKTIILKDGNNYVAGTVDITLSEGTQSLEIQNGFDNPTIFSAVFTFNSDSTLDTVRVTEYYRTFDALPWTTNRDTVYKAVSDNPIKIWNQATEVKARFWKYTFYGGDGNTFDLEIPYQIKYWRPSGY